MRTSLNEIKKIEDHLFQKSAKEDSLLMEARLILDPALRDKFVWQEKTYEVIKMYGRKKMKEDLDAIHRKLFLDPEHESFKNKILKIFNIRTNFK